jgi:predicted component of type VI protein secretion system
MPKLTLLLGRRTLKVYDLEKDRIRVGRDPGCDVVIDNPSVSREHAVFRQDGEGWWVQDLGSANGTFLAGEPIGAAQRVSEGDEVGFGKFSIVFGRALGSEDESAGRVQAAHAISGAEGTTYVDTAEVKRLLQESESKRKAHLLWESGGEQGTHYLEKAPALLIGTDELCDLRVPKAPAHHLLVMRLGERCEIRDLRRWSRMSVNGGKTRRATLNDGDRVEAGGLRLTFVGELG